jgi:CRP-like cAMP-binding protein
MMDDEAIASNNEQLRYVLLKNPENRSYDDLLVLKGFIVRSEFMQKNLAGIVNPKQMNDLCRQLGLETYSVGDTVFNQGDIGDKVFILLSGACDLRVRYRIDLTQGESEIREKFIKTYKERGSYFGERALQFDEPRSGTVIASAHTNLITVSKNSYISVIKEARLDSSNEVVASAEQLGTKESVITVLSKMRDKRTNQELDAVAGYLFRRIPFFQRFTMPQLIELCRVAETVSVWGRSILFKQGSIGQAFYVVLTGTVEVWVNNSEAPAATPANRVQHKAHDVTDGLGVKVNQLVSGEIFGERALENEDSMRMASIVTCEGNTELIIISREDYHNLVYVMMHADSMNRLTLLRRTDLFRTVDVQHLKSLARFMEPRKYQLNEPLYKVGSKALEIIIIESGECRVETEIREGLDQVEQAEMEKQRKVGYLEPTALHDGAYHHDEHGHQARGGHADIAAAAAAGGRSHTPFQDSAALTTSTESAGARPNSQPSGTSTKRKFSLPKITASSKNKSGAEAAGIVKPPPLSLDPVNSVAAKIRMKRLQTQQMISIGKCCPLAITQLTFIVLFTTQFVPVPVGKSHRINLGRIAPNSVLAMYVTSGSLADDVFHPETVIASTLVHAYTIGETFIGILLFRVISPPVSLLVPFHCSMITTAWMLNDRFSTVILLSRQARLLQPPAQGHALRDREDHRRLQGARAHLAVAVHAEEDGRGSVEEGKGLEALQARYGARPQTQLEHPRCV